MMNAHNSSTSQVDESSELCNKILQTTGHGDTLDVISGCMPKTKIIYNSAGK